MNHSLPMKDDLEESQIIGWDFKLFVHHAAGGEVYRIAPALAVTSLTASGLWPHLPRANRITMDNFLEGIDYCDISLIPEMDREWLKTFPFDLKRHP